MDLGDLQWLGEKGTREIWNDERNFSRWLSENISYLDDVLGIRIQIEELEGYVDNFKLDLSGIDGVSQRPVIIENQYGQSNHDHLGKLITYSAGRDAGIVVWIANQIQPAHRKAIEWLNKISPQEMSFYGVELEVLKIDQSRPSPYFKIVAGPPSAKRRQATPDDQVSPRNRRYQQFFDTLRGRLLELQPNFTRAKALPQSWWGLGIGRTGFSLSAAFASEGKFRIEIYIDTGVKEQNELALSKLEEDRFRIEEKIGDQMHWDYLRESRACRLYASTEGSIDDNEDKFRELIEWGAPLMIKFREVFSPLIRGIDLSGT